MAKITPKDNFLKLAGGGHPEYVPYYTFMGNEPIPETSSRGLPTGIFKQGTRNDDGSTTSIWGVTNYPNRETAGSSMPEPNVFILEDIRKWGDVIRKPESDLIRDDLNFEEMYKEALERTGIDRTQTAVRGGLAFGPWMTLFSFMGFEGALCAMAEEPEYVKEMFDWMTSLQKPYIEKVLDVFKPDIVGLTDDTCTERGPFFSVPMYRDVIKPYYELFAKPAMNRGIPIIFHICGNCEPFIPEMIDFGVKYIEPAQDCMDILALKEKYKGQMSYLGCHDWGKHLPKNYPDYDKEEVLADVRATIDKYSPGGAFGTLIWPVSYEGDPHIEDLKSLIWNECYRYGKEVYGYTD